MNPLVTSEWLADNVHDPTLRVLECTVDLKPTDGGFVAQEMSAIWAESHIPGSAYIDLTNDLSDPNSDLRFTMPTAEHFARAMEALGVGDDTQVVLYDRRFTMWATRIFWMLKAHGFDNCAVLDGGFKTWQAEGRLVSTEPAPARPTATFTTRPRPEMIASLQQMQAALGDGQTCIINSLSPENHNGADNSYGRPGHLPGASNVFAVALLDPATHRYKPVDELAAMFDHLPADQPIITYCGGGIAATSDAFVLTELLGHRDVAVYDGSLSEWIRDSDRPLVVVD
ncbi:MAG: thiosulfate/3-mercaptopyruvate sulfurtransferase [Acidimicrobiales bacterium]|jgi:thiosulfate/3-mercaptopyruvate sulfurtransferase